MKLFSNKYRYFFILFLAVYSFINTLFLEVFRYYGITQHLFYIILTFILICLLIWEGNRLLESLLKPLLRNKIYRIHPLLLFFILSLVVTTVACLVSYYFISAVLLDEPLSGRPVALKLALIFAFRVNLFLHCINISLFFLEKYKQKQLESEELRRISSQAELQAIRSQINPHFLFNNLNVLSTLVLQKNEDANRFIEAFSAVYRYILSNHEKELVPLQKELEFIEPYFFLLGKRFGEGLTVSIDIPGMYKDFYIVPVTLQMLIENCIKHNIVSSKKPLLIELFIEENYLTVRNNIQEKTMKETSTKWGLQNINRRYLMMTDKEIRIDKNDRYFALSVPLIKLSEI